MRFLRRVFQRIGDFFEDIIDWIKDAFYALSVKLHKKMPNRQGKKVRNRNRNEIIFLICILALPISKFIIFYIGVNINSILLAFQSYTPTGETVFAGFDNFKEVFFVLSGAGELRYGLKNSLLLYGMGTLISLPLSLLFSFYIYKRCFMAGFFKIILFLPSIISSLVSVLIFQYFVEDGISKLIGFNLLTKPSTSFGTIIFFNLWVGFGTGIIMYSNAMSKIDPSIVEYGRLEGVTPLREFISITLPMIFPTITSMFIMGIAGIFTNQAGLYSFFADTTEAYNQTIGYYMFIKILGEANTTEYPFAAAAGLLFTLICVPLTMSVRWLMEKFGPSEE